MKHIFPCYLSGILAVIFFGCQPTAQKEQEGRPIGWEIIETPTQASLRGLSPLTSEIVWASGTGGTWLLTLDGGKTWDTGVIDGMDSVDFRDIEALSANTAIAISAGQPAVIYKTVDAGKTWEKKFQGPSEAFFDGIAFYKDKKGIVIGDPIGDNWMILESSDQGDTWKMIESSPPAIPGEGSFAASGSGLLVDENMIWFASGGSFSRIYHSYNGGRNWNIYETPIIQGQPSQGIFSLTKMDNENMIGVGGDYLNPDLDEKNYVHSQDFGKSWHLSKGNNPSGYRSGVAYFPRRHWAIAVGTNGADFSGDGGHNWEKFSEEGFHAVFMDKAQSSIWASGGNGKIAKLIY